MCCYLMTNDLVNDRMELFEQYQLLTGKNPKSKVILKVRVNTMNIKSSKELPAFHIKPFIFSY